MSGVTIQAGGAPNGVLGTSVASTSGTSIDFTGIPSWVKRITVMFVGLSTNGTSNPIVQLGDSGGIETTGYLGGAVAVSSAAGISANSTVGILISSSIAAATVFHGSMVLSLVVESTNTWVGMTALGASNTAAAVIGGGSKSLSATLDRIRLTMTNGTDAFDAGTVNIFYER